MDLTFLLLQIRQIRNQIIHAGDYRLKTHDVKIHLQNMIEMVKVSNQFDKTFAGNLKKVKEHFDTCIYIM